MTAGVLGKNRDRSLIVGVTHNCRTSWNDGIEGACVFRKTRVQLKTRRLVLLGFHRRAWCFRIVIDLTCWWVVVALETLVVVVTGDMDAK